MVQWISRKPRAYSNKNNLCCKSCSAAQWIKRHLCCTAEEKKKRKKKADVRIFLSQAYLPAAGWEGAVSSRSYLQPIQLPPLYIEGCVCTCQGSDSPLDLCCIQGAQGRPTASVWGEKKNSSWIRWICEPNEYMQHIQKYKCIHTNGLINWLKTAAGGGNKRPE